MVVAPSALSSLEHLYPERTVGRQRIVFRRGVGHQYAVLPVLSRSELISVERRVGHVHLPDSALHAARHQKPNAVVAPAGG
jgi:hypothetical protein